MSIRLPDPIEHYIRIENSGALEAVSDCFAADAIVHDEGKSFEGLAAEIRPHRCAARIRPTRRQKRSQGEARRQLSGKSDHGEL